MNTFPTTLIFTILALAFVLALAWLILKALSGFNRRRSINSLINIKESIPISARDRLLVVHYRGSDYLLSTSAQGVQLIDKHLPEASPVQAANHRIGKNPS